MMQDRKISFPWKIKVKTKEIIWKTSQLFHSSPCTKNTHKKKHAHTHTGGFWDGTMKRWKEEQIISFSHTSILTLNVKWNSSEINYKASSQNYLSRFIDTIPREDARVCIFSLDAIHSFISKALILFRDYLLVAISVNHKVMHFNTGADFIKHLFQLLHSTSR